MIGWKIVEKQSYNELHISNNELLYDIKKLIWSLEIKLKKNSAIYNFKRFLKIHQGSQKIRKLERS